MMMNIIYRRRPHCCSTPLQLMMPLLIEILLSLSSLLLR
jgi:hypothetical protein